MKNLNFFLKKYFLAVIIFCISGTMFAQVEKEVTLTSSVDLSSALNSLGTDLNTITKLAVINNTDGVALSSTDFATLNAMQALTQLDLSADEKTTVLTSNAFVNNATIETIELPSKLNNIGGGVFNGSALKGVLSFPPSLTGAGSLPGSFNNCQGITAFAFPENTVITAVDGVAFTDRGATLLKYPCGKPDTEYVVPEGVIKIQEQSFFYNHILEILTLPATMQQIVGNSTFRESTAFKAVYVAEGNPLYASSSGILVDRTAKSLIYCPPKITEVIVDGTLVETTPTYRFFGGSPDVQKMVFTEGVLSISDNGARLNNSENLTAGSGALTEIYLPSTITRVGGDAFCRRGNVTLIVCRAVTPPACGNNAFYDVGKSDPDPLTIYVPAASLSSYAGWGNLSGYGGVYKAFYNITLTDDDGTESIQSPIGTDIAYAGATVTISAPAAPEGKVFDKWVAVSTGTVAFENDDVTLASTTITMPAADVTLTPTYVSSSEMEVTGTSTDLILTGDWDSELFNTIIGANVANITTIDFTGLTNLELPVIDGLNPNCLIYVNQDVALAEGSNNIVVFNGEEGIASNVILTEGADFNNTKDFTAGNVSYSRNFMDNGWFTMCLPFNVDKGDLIVEEFTGVDENEVVFTQTQAIEANIPYLIKTDNPEVKNFKATNARIYSTVNLSPVTPAVGYALHANYRAITGDAAVGLYLMHGNGDAFAKVAEGNPNASGVPAFRAYFTAATNKQLAIAHDNGGVTNIDSDENTDKLIIISHNGFIEIRTNKAQVMNLHALDGRLAKVIELNEGANFINGLNKGIYIINCQKVVVE